MPWGRRRTQAGRRVFFAYAAPMNENKRRLQSRTISRAQLELVRGSDGTEAAAANKGVTSIQPEKSEANAETIKKVR